MRSHKGSRTPGWNDPPPMVYNPLVGTASGGNRPRLDLKKRVAYPLQGTVAGNAAGGVSKPTAIVPPNTLASNLSPLPPQLGPPNKMGSTPPANIAVVHPMPQMVSNDTNTDGAAALQLPENAWPLTLDVLKCQIRCIPTTANISQEDITTRIMSIERQWQSGELSVDLKQRIYQLGEAIRNRNYSVAMQIYTNLVVNNSSQCSSWATALRHIILTLDERSSSSSSSYTNNANNNSNINNNSSIITTVAPSGNENSVNLFVANSNHHSTGSAAAAAVQHI